MVDRTTLPRKKKAALWRVLSPPQTEQPPSMKDIRMNDRMTKRACLMHKDEQTVFVMLVWFERHPESTE